MMVEKATYMLIITAIALVAFSSPIVLAAIWPIRGTSTSDDLTSPFGPRMKNSTTYDFHRGIDIHTGGNIPVYAVMDGTIKYTRELGDFGRYVVIVHIFSFPKTSDFLLLTYQNDKVKSNPFSSDRSVDLYQGRSLTSTEVLSNGIPWGLQPCSRNY